MCVSVRVDNANLNTAETQRVAGIWQNPTTGLIYLAWCSSKVLGDGTNKNIYFNTFDPETKTAGTPLLIASSATLQAYDGVSMVVLDDGTIILSSGFYTVEAWESTTGGLTFTGPVNVDPGGTRGLGGLVTDGVNVWALTQEYGGGGTQSDLYVTKRISAGLWDTPILIDNTPGFSTSPFYEIFATYRLSSMRAGGMVDANNGFFLLGYSNASANEDQVRAIWTTNGWASGHHETVVADYTTGDATASFARLPVTLRGRGDVFYAMWIRNHPVYGEIPVLSSTADGGQTWTTPYTPTQFQGISWDNAFNRAFAIDSHDNLYCSSIDESDGTNHKHQLFRSTADPNVWVQTTCEHLAFSISTASAGDGFIYNGDFYRVFDQVRGGTYYSVDVLYEEHVSPEDLPPPPLIEESPSGSDANNIYLRNELAIERGWSIHDFPVGCWATWGEGDYTTQRRKPILLAGAGTLDPTVTDPSVLGAIFKLDDPEHLGRESWTYDEGGNVIVRYDPDPAVWWSKAFALGPSFEQGVLRAIMFRYRRPTLPLVIETWIDGVIAQTDTLPPSGPDESARDIAAVKDVFLPLNPYDNVGSVAQLRLEDETLDDLVIEECLLVYIKKGLRG